MLYLTVGVVAANLATWALAWPVLGGHAGLLGMALVAYVYGLRHGVDADHVAAIDNVTRNLMQRGRPAAAAGLCFSLGHAGVVAGLSAAVAATAGSLHGLAAMRGMGDGVGTAISAGFLLVIAISNLMLLARPRRRRLFGLIAHSWQMLPLGMLFGLGFDTASEVGLLGISAIQGAHGLSPWGIMVFPLLFAAGMALVDTLDSALMLRAYGWAGGRRYARALTLLSAGVAIAVACLEAGHLLGAGPILAADPGVLGLAVIMLFTTIWAVSVARQWLRPAA
jgi:nickel/cobalt transporter (NiCoT) family protein